MNIAFIGCGYVAEFYFKTLSNYPDLKLIGAYDLNKQNLQIFCDRSSARSYASLEQLLGDASVDLVLNLTNPRSHFEVTKRCLEAGKHVYSEKPLAMDAARARELVDKAKLKNVYLACAPCNLLSETAQTIWKALRDGVVGQVRLVYGSFDDGDGHEGARTSGVEERIWGSLACQGRVRAGCTYEHAGYVLDSFEPLHFLDRR